MIGDFVELSGIVPVFRHSSLGGSNDVASGFVRGHLVGSGLGLDGGEVSSILNVTEKLCLSVEVGYLSKIADTCLDLVGLAIYVGVGCSCHGGLSGVVEVNGSAIVSLALMWP